MMLSAFPHLTDQEFSEGCAQLVQSLENRRCEPSEWVSAEHVKCYDAPFLQVSKGLSLSGDASQQCAKIEDDLEEVHEDDEEVLHVMQLRPVVRYDILLSPIYRVPVLYFYVSDSLHRYPATMATLYSYLIPPQFKSETEKAGVMGGITISDHPITNKPVFFIHPCQTTQVMEVSLANQDVSAYHYLLVWMGALGRCVGLDVPLSLARTGEQ